MNTPYLQETEEGVVLAVWAKPGASKNSVMGPYGDNLKVSVQAPPEKGKANRALEKLLAKVLQLSDITLISGDTSREKRFLIRDMSRDELARRLQASMSS